jgi:hypothetical protein
MKDWLPLIQSPHLCCLQQQRAGEKSGSEQGSRRAIPHQQLARNIVPGRQAKLGWAVNPLPQAATQSWTNLDLQPEIGLSETAQVNSLPRPHCAFTQHKQFSVRRIFFVQQKKLLLLGDQLVIRQQVSQHPGVRQRRKSRIERTVAKQHELGCTR